MIERTFLHLPGVGEATEKKIWKQGVTTWSDFLRAKGIEGIGKEKKLFLDREISKARQALLDNNHAYFAQNIPLSEQWRLYEWFREEAVFLDIETCGGYGYVTVVGLYDGFDVKHLVRGANLSREALARELSRYKIVVTFNGSSFDIPVLDRYFRKVVPDIPHVDLRHVCSRIGLTGGLKLIEQQLGIKRQDSVEYLRSGDAVLLWDQFRVTRNERYLKMLLDYNAEDVINLKPLADYAVSEMKNKIMPHCTLSAGEAHHLQD